MPLAASIVPDPLASNLACVRARVRAAAERAGRAAEAIRIVGVTKSVDVALARALFDLGLADLGENRVDALERRIAEFERAGRAPRWHFIGHLQRNKARRVAQLDVVVHSVDGVELARALSRHAETAGRVLDAYVQVMVHGEATKSGVAPERLREALDAIAGLPHLRVVGLMALAPLAESADEKLALARATFRTTAELARDLASRFAAPPLLSMGMSDDFEIAIEEGSDVVRIGGALFAGLSERAR